MMEKLLLFGTSESDHILQIASRMHLRTMIVSPEQYHTPLGTLAGYTEVHTKEMTVPESDALLPEGIIVLCGLKNNQIDRLLNQLRQAGLQRLYKAILTPTNAAWNVFQLSYELGRERTQWNQPNP